MPHKVIISKCIQYAQQRPLRWLEDHWKVSPCFNLPLLRSRKKFQGYKYAKSIVRVTIYPKNTIMLIFANLVTPMVDP